MTSISHETLNDKAPPQADPDDLAYLRDRVSAAARVLKRAIAAVSDAGVAVQTAFDATERVGLKDTNAAHKLDDIANDIACLESDLEDYRADLGSIRNSRQ
jgi:hypothetical protein